MKENEKKKKGRKAIFVNAEVFAMFKKAAQNDGRKYSEFLEHLLEVTNNV